MKKVLISGVSSFTGSWIALHLGDSFEVHGLCSNKRSHYTDLRNQRLKLLDGKVQIHFEVDLAQETSLKIIKDIKPHVWIHHHHFMEDFRSPNYDVKMFKKICLDPLPKLVLALVQSGCENIVFSGSFFEPGEGGAKRPKPTPYGESKLIVWNELTKLTAEKMACSKVVIPNPTGPLENRDRLIPQMLEAAKQKKSFSLKFPNMFSDHLPANELAEVYKWAVDSSLNGKSKIFRPSGVVKSNLDWMNLVNEQLIVGRLGFPKLNIDLSQADPTVTTGFENPNGEKMNVDLNRFWKDYASAVAL